MLVLGLHAEQEVGLRAVATDGEHTWIGESTPYTPDRLPGG